MTYCVHQDQNQPHAHMAVVFNGMRYVYLVVQTLNKAVLQHCIMESQKFQFLSSAEKEEHREYRTWLLSKLSNSRNRTPEVYPYSNSHGSEGLLLLYLYQELIVKYYEKLEEKLQ